MTGYGPDSRISTVWSYLSMSIPTEINTVGVGHASCLLPIWFQTKFNSEIRLKPVQLHSAPLEKEMATHSSTLAWKISWTEEPCSLQSMASQSRTRLSDFTSFLYFKFHFHPKSIYSSLYFFLEESCSSNIFLLWRDNWGVDSFLAMSHCHLNNWWFSWEIN